MQVEATRIKGKINIKELKNVRNSKKKQQNIRCYLKYDSI